MSALGYAALIVGGGVASMVGPLLVARHLVEGHADRTAAAIRARHGVERVDQAADVDELVKAVAR